MFFVGHTKTRIAYFYVVVFGNIAFHHNAPALVIRREQGRCYLAELRQVMAGVIFLRSKIGEHCFPAKRTFKKLKPRLRKL